MTVTRSCSLLALLLLLPTEVVGMAVRPKLTVFRTGPQLRPPARETPAADAGARDVMLKLYDISSPPLVSAFQALAFKEGFWFPKLSIGVGRSCWSYDGEPEALHPLSSGPSPPPSRFSRPHSRRRTMASSRECREASRCGPSTAARPASRTPRSRRSSPRWAPPTTRRTESLHETVFI